VGKRTARTGHGSLASGAVTALAIAVQSGLAAVVGVIIAREVGLTAETDGFFAAYAVFIVLALAATAMRVTLLPPLARARAAGRLSSETVAYAVTVALVAAPMLLIGVLAAGPIADVLTGSGPPAAQDAAAEALPWMIVAGLGQFTAALLASTLAALDDYVVAALGFVVGSVTGLAVILLAIDDHGTEAVAWGMALNATIATLVPAFWLWRRARAERMPARAARADLSRTWTRLVEIGNGAALPFALQATYLVCVPIAAREGVGAQTSFGYAFLVTAAVVGVTASSLGLVTSVPLTRIGLSPDGVARHVDSSSWLALLAIGATAGFFAVAGANVTEAVLGDAYSDEAGTEIARLVVALAPYMVVSVAFSVTFPLVFVAGLGRRLPLVALAVVAVHIPLALAGQQLAGLWGLALALAVSTAHAAAWLLHLLHALVPTVRGLGAAVAVVAAIVGIAFAPVALLDRAILAGFLGLALATALVAVTRPPGLVAAWRYLRELA
jgi:O-antigen/teichoic acid export membrane protein